MTSGFAAINSAAVVWRRSGFLPGHAALDDEIAPLDPAEPPQGVKEIAARERLPGDDETDMCALGRLLRRCAADDGGSRHAE